MTEKNKYYEGSELKWSIEDVFRVAEQNDIKGISKDDAETILHHTFEDNDSIMQFINEEIQDTIETFLNQNKET